MIHYYRRAAGVNLLTRVYGAAWPRSMVLAIPCSICSALLEVFWNDEVAACVRHPYAMSGFATVLALTIIFRTNLSYARYWEGRTMIAQMSSKWADAAIQVISFDEVAKEPAASCGVQFRAEFLHMMSLMHALALQRIRGDDNISNLTEGSLVDIPKNPLPADPAKNLAWKESIGLKSIFSLRSTHRRYVRYWKFFPLPVLGGVSMGEQQLLKSTEDRVYCVHCWIHRCLVARRMEGGIREEAPIVSRIYQVISDGMVGFENAYKLANTPFPFPYAQCVVILIYFHSIVVTPLVMVAWLETPCLVGLMAFLTVLAYYMLNEVARDIEEPFRYDPNDLPLWLFHHRFNARLVTALCKSLIPEGGVMQHLNPEVTKKLVEASRPKIMEWWRLGKDCEGEDSLSQDSASELLWNVKTRMVSSTPEINPVREQKSGEAIELQFRQEVEDYSEGVAEDEEAQEKSGEV